MSPCGAGARNPSATASGSESPRPGGSRSSDRTAPHVSLYRIRMSARTPKQPTQFPQVRRNNKPPDFRKRTRTAVRGMTKQESLLPPIVLSATTPIGRETGTHVGVPSADGRKILPPFFSKTDPFAKFRKSTAKMERSPLCFSVQSAPTLGRVRASSASARSWRPNDRDWLARPARTPVWPCPLHRGPVGPSQSSSGHPPLGHAAQEEYRYPSH